MKIQQKIEEIREIILPLLALKAIELVDVELKGNVGNQVLRIYVDVDGGITLNQCAELSREISDLLEIGDVLPGKYRLDVSSPGTDRPLKTIRDFERNTNRDVVVVFIDGSSDDGSIEKVETINVWLKKGDQIVKFPISDVKHGKIKLKW